MSDDRSDRTDRTLIPTHEPLHYLDSVRPVVVKGSNYGDKNCYDIYIRTPTLCLIESIFNDSNSDNNRNYTTVVGPQDSKRHPNWQYSSRQFLCDKNVGVDDEFLRWT